MTYSMLKILVIAAALLTFPAAADASPVHPMCAMVNNTANVATWGHPGAWTTARYTDDGHGLRFDRPVVPVVMTAVAKLRIGAPGPKITLACVWMR